MLPKLMPLASFAFVIKRASYVVAGAVVCGLVIWLALYFARNPAIHASKVHHQSVNAIIVAKDGMTLFSASSDGTLMELDAVTLRPKSTVYSGGVALESLAESPGGQYLAAGSLSGQIVVANMLNHGALKIYDVTTSDDTAYNSICFSPVGGEIYSARRHGVVAFDRALRSSRALL